MVKISEIEQFMCETHPLKLAESWDNVGLLLGRRDRHVTKLMTCLTVSLDVVAEAKAKGVELILSHHPFPFKAANKFTDGSTEGRLLLDLLESKIAVFSSHTAFDSVRDGINAMTLKGLGLDSSAPLIPKDDLPGGTGRMSACDWTWEDALRRIQTFYDLKNFWGVKCGERFRKVGIVCGSGGDFISTAKSKGVDLFITGEATFHQCVLARHLGVTLVLTGHFKSERFAMEQLADKLQAQFSSLSVFPSVVECDPLMLLGEIV